jgi:hypothetical protein
VPIVIPIQEVDGTLAHWALKVFGHDGIGKELPSENEK